MNASHCAGTVALCLLLLVHVVLLPACTQSSRVRPDNVKELMASNGPIDYYEDAFKPVPEEELAAFKLPERMPYRLEAGDVVTVQALNSTPVPGYQGGFEARVKESGIIKLPLGVVVEARGKTVEEVEDLITPTIQAQYKKAIVSVQVTDFASRVYFVVGEVGTPGALFANGRTSLMEALINVGGTKEESADLDEAYIIRDGKPIPFSVKQMVMSGHPIGRMVMQEYDIVFVPHVDDRSDFVYVFGEVGNPTRVPMDRPGPRGSQGQLTLAAAVAEAGGLDPRANINDISVFRGSWPNPQQWCLSRCDLYQSGHNIYLKPGDRIAVGTSTAAKFSDAIGPGLTVLSATTSALSLALSAVALSRN